MQLFINNFSASLTAPVGDTDLLINIDPAQAAKLVGIGGGNYYLLTLVGVDVLGKETSWEIVKATAVASGALTVERAQEGTEALSWPLDAPVQARWTAGSVPVLIPVGTPVTYSQEIIQDIGAGSGARSVDITQGSYVVATADATAATWTFTATPDTGAVMSWTLELTNGGAAAQTFTGVKWADGVAPTLTPSGVDILVFTKRGTTTRGYLAAGNSL